MTPSIDGRQNLATTTVIELERKTFSDQTGRFPVTSSTGSKYVVVLFDVDTNVILTTAIKNRSQEELIRAHKYFTTYLGDRGFKPKIHILDNECPDLLKKHFQSNQIQHQLVPPPPPPLQQGRASNCHLQVPFHCGLGSNRPKLPTPPLGPAAGTRNAHSKPAPPSQI